MSTDLDWALNDFEPNRRREAYAKAVKYDQGEHPLAFASEKFRTVFFDIIKGFKENLSSSVVDALADRLQVVGFKSTEAKIEKETVPSTIPGVPGRPRVKVVDDMGQKAWDIWKRNKMELRSTEVHRESILTGDAYVIVWPNEDGEVDIFPQLATECAIEYDSNKHGVVSRGAKWWWNPVEKKFYMNIYLPDGILKYEAKESSGQMPLAKKSSWTLYDEIPSPYGMVPMFHFPNRQENKYGISELRDVYPIQDGLNKAGIDMLVAMEYAAYKQRYVIGMEVELDEQTGQPKDANAKNYGVDRMMAIPDIEAKVGQFDATDLQEFLRVQDKFWLSAARVTGTPLHYFYLTSGDFPSGEAIKSAEGRFIKRIGDQQTAKGGVWEDVITFALRIEESVADDLSFDTMWGDATPRSEAELADTAVKKKAIGVPRSQLLREQGYTDEEIDQFLEESDAETMAAFVTRQQTGGPGAGNQEIGGAAGTSTGNTGDQARGRQGSASASGAGG